MNEAHSSSSLWSRLDSSARGRSLAPCGALERSPWGHTKERLMWRAITRNQYQFWCPKTWSSENYMFLVSEVIIWRLELQVYSSMLWQMVNIPKNVMSCVMTKVRATHIVHTIWHLYQNTVGNVLISKRPNKAGLHFYSMTTLHAFEKKKEKKVWRTKPFVFELIFKGENKGAVLARGKTEQLDSVQAWFLVNTPVLQLK